MNNQFTIKDLLMFVLLVGVLITLWLSMVQTDLRHEQLQDIADAQKEQAQVLREISTALKNGVVLNGRNAHANGDQAEQFPRLAAARKNPDFAYGDWYIDAFRQTVGKLTPLVQTDAYQSVIQSYILESLIVRDPETLEWRPWIAHSWQVSEDGLQITFDLRQEVTFSDGSPLTAHDVVFTYRMITNPEINCPALRTYYENIASVEAPNDYRVVFKMEEPYFRSLDFTGGMSILPRKFYEKLTPEEFNEMPGLLVGSGPYRLEADPLKWQPGSDDIVLVRNENYWGVRPSFNKLVFRQVSDENGLLVAFRNRKVDRYGVTPEKYESLKADEGLNAQATRYEYAFPNSGYRYLGWNQRRNGKATFFADKRVRQAMTLLTNRKEMAEQLMAGLATVATGPFNPLGAQADPKIEPWPYDPDRAKQLLTQAGFKDRDGDGVIESEDGAPFRFKLIYPASSENYKQMAFYLKDAYARAGIVLQPDPTEWNTMLQRIDERNFDAITLGWTGSIEGDPKQIFHSDSVAGGGSNYIGYSNKELDKLIDTARLELDESKRLPMWRKAHAIFHEDQPYTFLFFQKAVVLIDNRVKNVQITRTGMNDRVEYYVPASQQLWTD